MFVDETKIFYVDGIPVAFPFIIQWWDEYCNRVPIRQRTIQDPHMSEKACWHIANTIVNDMRRKIGGEFSSTYRPPKDETPHSTLGERNRNISTFVEDPDTAGIDWLNDDVIAKAFDILEEKWKKKRNEEIQKQKERANFWQNQQNSKHNTSPPKDQVFNWRQILGFAENEVVTEELIKKKYRKEAMKRHPDKGGTEKLINDLFNARDLAYRFLGKDPP
jgi:hypothetical protein